MYQEQLCFISQRSINQRHLEIAASGNNIITDSRKTVSSNSWVFYEIHFHQTTVLHRHTWYTKIRLLLLDILLSIARHESCLGRNEVSLTLSIFKDDIDFILLILEVDDLDHLPSSIHHFRTHCSINP